MHTTALASLPNSGVSGCSRLEVNVLLPLGIWHWECSAGDYSFALSCLCSSVKRLLCPPAPSCLLITVLGAHVENRQEEHRQLAELTPLCHLNRVLAEAEKSWKPVRNKQQTPPLSSFQTCTERDRLKYPHLFFNQRNIVVPNHCASQSWRRQSLINIANWRGIVEKEGLRRLVPCSSETM